MYTIELATLQEAAYLADLEESAIYPDYSGRAMFGAKCVGLVHHSASELMTFALALNRLTDGEVEEWLPDSRQDNMGMSTITYWPQVQVAEQEATP